MYLTEAARRRGPRRGQHSVPEVALSETRLSVWEERDRAHVELINTKNDATIVEWWDDDVKQAIEDGFLKPGKLHETAYDYAIHVGLIKRPQHAHWTQTQHPLPRAKENPAHAHPGSYLPINIGEKRTFEAHGQSYSVKYHSRNTYVLSTEPPGQRKRWGNRDQIMQDIAYVLENGSLPPASRSQAFENPSGPLGSSVGWEVSRCSSTGQVRSVVFVSQENAVTFANKNPGSTIREVELDPKTGRILGYPRSARENPVQAHDFETQVDAIKSAQKKIKATHYAFRQSSDPVVYRLDEKGEWWLEWQIYFKEGKFHVPSRGHKARDPYGKTPDGQLPPDARPIKEAAKHIEGIYRSMRQANECGCEHGCGVQENPVEVSDGIPWVKSERNAEDFEEVRAVAEKVGPIKGARSIYDLMSPWAARQDKEHLVVILLDIHSMLRGVSVVHIGTRDRVTVDPSDVLKPAIDRGAKGIAIMHNHPSGAADHSPADASLTKAMKQACKANDIAFVDHVVMGTNEYYSFTDKKLTKVRKK